MPFADVRNGFFDESELILYLSAFGHSVAAELTRLETLAADQAKGNFISSVSHELRYDIDGQDPNLSKTF